MNTYDYYTPQELADLLIDYIPDMEVKTVVDICCGTWNLLRAAKKKIPNAIITGVDISASHRENAIENAVFFQEDGRMFAIKESFDCRTYDLILSNPPYGKLDKEERKYENIIRHETNWYPGLTSNRYENEMTQANLLLTHDYSVVLSILPRTFVEGESYKKAREQIAQDYSIDRIIRLPQNTFRGKIHTYCIIMRRGVRQEECVLMNALKQKSTWSIERQGKVRPEKIWEGFWLGEDFVDDNKTIDIRRGSISSSTFCSDGAIVLHTSVCNGEAWRPSCRKYKMIRKAVVKVHLGDIIINRIGKGAGFWCVSEYDNVAVSDCLIVIKHPNRTVLRQIQETSTDEGRLCIPIRGVATPFITVNDVKTIFD